jgi:hypothetical protein
LKETAIAPDPPPGAVSGEPNTRDRQDREAEINSHRDGVGGDENAGIIEGAFAREALA